MAVDNVLTVSKTRVPPLKRGVFAEPGPEVAQKILDWLNEGEESLPSVTNYRDRAVAKHATREDLLALLEEVEGRNLASASVVDDEGETVALKELIVRKGRALAPAAVPPAGGEQQRERNPAGARPSAAGGWRAALTAEELEALGDWEDAIDAITAPEDREVLDADLDGAGDQMSMIRGTAIRKAIDAKVAEVTPRAAAA
jgi:hypothetical protein